MEMKLVIGEKPSVAKTIAGVVAGQVRKRDGYFEGDGYLISWCVGHLAEPAPPEKYGEQWKTWSRDSLPVIPQKWEYVLKESTKGQYKVLHRLMHDERVTEIVAATDAGREGELIFRLLYDMTGCKKPVKRLWISSMEENAILAGFENLQPGSSYDDLYRSALCRQKADWLVGINGTRLFTTLYGGRVLKVGRVQTPTLAMLADREAEIRGFQKEKYYTVHILIDGIDAATGRIDDKKKAEEIAEACRNGQAHVISVVKEEKAVIPPRLYDLTALQRDANRLFGFTAKQTLEHVQSLYEKKLATYPRTDSRYLTDDMGDTAKGVIKAVSSLRMFGENRMDSPDIDRISNSSKVTDHHAIIPTMEIVKADLAALPETERRILYLIADRLLCAAGEKHYCETVKAEFSCNGHTFSVSGKSVIHNGWKAFEDVFRRSFQDVGNKEDENREKKLPELSEGQAFDGVQTKISEHFTTPPKHFTEDSLLAAMEHAGAEDMGSDVERKGLGTPATRADVIEKLVRDGFVKRERKQLIPTGDGLKLITVLPDVVKSPKLTADWENALALVAKGKLSMEEFMADIENMVSELVHGCHKVDGGQKEMFAKEREMLGACPNCGGQVAKGKFGAYCMNKCGMNVSRVMGAALTDAQVKDMIAGKKILLKGLKSRNGRPYDAYIIPVGTEEYRYIKDGEEKSGVQYKFQMEFPEKKLLGKKK